MLFRKTRLIDFNRKAFTASIIMKIRRHQLRHGNRSRITDGEGRIQTVCIKSPPEVVDRNAARRLLNIFKQRRNGAFKIRREIVVDQSMGTQPLAQGRVGFIAGDMRHHKHFVRTRFLLRQRLHFGVVDLCNVAVIIKI